MQRRKFIRNSLATGVTGLISSSVFASNERKEKRINTYDGKPFHLYYAIHDGMFKNNAGTNFIDQIKFAYDQGFRAMEDNGMTGRPVAEQEKIGDTMSKLGMHMGVFVLD